MQYYWKADIQPGTTFLSTTPLASRWSHGAVFATECEGSGIFHLHTNAFEKYMGFSQIFLPQWTRPENCKTIEDVSCKKEEAWIPESLCGEMRLLSRNNSMKPLH